MMMRVNGESSAKDACPAMTVAKTIESKLKAKLEPDQIDIVDESDKHKGHAGARPGGETHFRLVIVSKAFEGKSPVERQRLVYAALREELDGPIHALAMRTLTPEEKKRGD
jgi:BolA protein